MKSCQGQRTFTEPVGMLQRLCNLRIAILQLMGPTWPTRDFPPQSRRNARKAERPFQLQSWHLIRCKPCRLRRLKAAVVASQPFHCGRSRAPAKARGRLVHSAGVSLVAVADVPFVILPVTKEAIALSSSSVRPWAIGAMLPDVIILRTCSNDINCSAPRLGT